MFIPLADYILPCQEQTSDMLGGQLVSPQKSETRFTILDEIYKESNVTYTATNTSLLQYTEP